MIENTELSTTILEVIADTESYPANLTQDNIRNSDAIRESFGGLSTDVIVFHEKMLEETGLIKVRFDNTTTFVYGNPTYSFTIIGLTKQGSDCIRNIKSPFWNKAKQKLKSIGKPETIQSLYSLYEKLIQQS